MKDKPSGIFEFTLLLAFIICSLASLSDLHRHTFLALSGQSDFQVYFTAANLVHDHLGQYLYEEAGTGTDPQLRNARSGGVMAQEARKEGIDLVNLYVYPPFLADILMPLTKLPLKCASWAWRAINLLGVLETAACIATLLGFRLLSLRSLMVLTGLLCFSPLWQGMHYGQITIVLLSLWSTGIVLYTKGWERTSALLLAAAVLIKIVPLLVIVPILVWRDWRWIRWLFVGLVSGLSLVLLDNNFHELTFYVLHVVPPMSAGIVERENQTLLSALQMFWRHGNSYVTSTPSYVLWAGRTLSASFIGIATFLTFRLGPSLPRIKKPFVLAAFALLSLCVSPVSWVDALVIGYLVVALLWLNMAQSWRSYLELALLFTCTIGMGASLGIKHIHRWDGDTFVQFVPLFSAISISLYALYVCGHWRPAHLVAR